MKSFFILFASIMIDTFGITKRMNNLSSKFSANSSSCEYTWMNDEFSYEFSMMNYIVRERDSRLVDPFESKVKRKTNPFTVFFVGWPKKYYNFIPKEMDQFQDDVKSTFVYLLCLHLHNVYLFNVKSW